MNTKKLLLLISLCSFSLLIKAQNVAYLDTGNVNALINANGILFSDRFNSQAAYEVPKGSNAHTIFASSFWMSSVRQNGNLTHISTAYDLFGYENQFKTGPVDIVNQTSDSNLLFQRLWRVKKSTIDDHIQNWNTSNYTIPQSIAHWPGNGTSINAQNLAPYKDLDNDNIYEPQDGEYPIIKGDQAIFFMLNDYGKRAQDTIKTSGSSALYTHGPLKIEMHVMLYAFDAPQQSIANTIFTNIKIFNRSNSSLDDHNEFKFSVYADFDIGNPTDDYVGSDSTHNLFYGYNGDLFDESFAGNSGYGSYLAAQGIQFLSHPIRHAMYYNSGTSHTGDPTLPHHYVNYQNNIWKNDSLVINNGDGFSNLCQGTTPSSTNFMFNGDPTLINTPSEWTETSPCPNTTVAQNPPGDRRMIGGPQIPTQLLHGNHIEFDYAYIFAQDYSMSSHVSDPVGKLFLVADTVQKFFNTPIPVSVNEIKKPAINFQLYPNPAKNQVKVQVDATQFDLQIMDITGNLVFSSSNVKEINLSSLSKGIYFVKVTQKSTSSIKKLVLVD